MKKILILSILFFAINIFAQKTVSVVIILKDNDTLKTNLIIPFNVSSKNKFILNEGKRESIKTSDIHLLSYNYNGKDILFVEDNDSLKQVLFEGKKIKWYKTFTNNLYDGSVMDSDYIENEKNEKVRIGIYKKSKDKLKEITNNNPAINEILDNSKIDEEVILKVLKLYEESK